MARKDEALEHLLAGKSPSKIAAEMQISVKSVMGYLFQQVGEGRIHRSDILFSIPAEIRGTIKSAVSKYGPHRRGLITRALNKAGQKISTDDVLVYLKLRNQYVELGDTYDAIREVELLLHGAAEKELAAKFGATLWWDRCVPKRVRDRCVEMLQSDDTPAKHPFCYTTLAYLRDIYKKNWAHLSRLLPPEFQSDRQHFSSSLRRLNVIRNAVMHPAKNIPVTEDDFHFVRKLFRALDGKVKGALSSLATLESMTVTSRIQ